MARVVRGQARVVGEVVWAKLKHRREKQYKELYIGLIDYGLGSLINNIHPSIHLSIKIKPSLSGSPLIFVYFIFYFYFCQIHLQFILLIFLNNTRDQKLSASDFHYSFPKLASTCLSMQKFTLIYVNNGIPSSSLNLKYIFNLEVKMSPHPDKTTDTEG